MEETTETTTAKIMINKPPPNKRNIPDIAKTFFLNNNMKIRIIKIILFF